MFMSMDADGAVVRVRDVAVVAATAPRTFDFTLFPFCCFLLNFLLAPTPPASPFIIMVVDSLLLLISNVSLVPCW